jgi:hypothetical protein
LLNPNIAHFAKIGLISAFFQKQGSVFRSN